MGPHSNAKKDRLTGSNPAQSTSASGAVAFATDTASRAGPTVRDMKANGEIIKRMGRGPSGTWTEISTQASGGMIKRTGKDAIPRPTGRNMKVSGRTTCSMVMELKSGLMEAGMKGTIEGVRSTDSALTAGEMAVSMQDSGLTTKLTETGRISGQMEEGMKESGRMA